MKFIRQNATGIRSFLIIIGVLLYSNYTDTSASDSDGPFFINPVIIYPETVTICFMPFDTSGEFETHRKKMTDILRKHGDFNYNFILPDKDRANKIYKDGFNETDDKQKMTKIYPKYEYWKKSYTQYVIFGYLKTDDKILLEVFLYDVRDAACPVSKRFKGNKDTIDEILEAVCISITDALKKKHLSKDDPYIKK